MRPKRTIPDFRTAIAVGAAALLLGTAAFAQIDRTKKPAPGPAPKAAFPEYVMRELPNGLKVFVITNTSQPLVSFRLMIKSGAEYEDAGRNGVQTLVTDLLTKGTEKRTSLQFATEADIDGISIGAGGGDDAMYVSGSGLKKYTDKILDLMTDALLHPSFPQEELDKAKKQTISGLTSEKKDPDAISGRLQITVGFNDHPYANFAVESEITAITRDDLVAFHRKFFIPNNASLAIVGDVTAKEILPAVTKAFGAWPKGNVPERNFPAPKPISGRSVDLVDLGATQTQTSLAVLATGMRRADPDWIAFSMLNSILGGGFSGRLFQNLREKHGFTYGAYSSMDGRRDAGLFDMSASVRRIATDSAVTEILHEMQRLRDSTVTENELQMHQQYASGRFLLSLESPDVTATRLQDIDLYGLPADYYKTYVTRLMRVTPGDVHKLAMKYLSPENIAITAVGDAAAIKDGLEKFGPVHSFDTDMHPVEAPVTLPLDLDTETLLRKHFDATGGQDKIAAVKDRTMDADVTMKFGPQSVKGTLHSVSKLPNKKYEKLVIEMGPQKMIQEDWDDGTKKVTIAPMQGSKTYEGDDLAKELEDDQMEALFRAKELGYTATAVAKRAVDGTLVYVLDLKRPLGTTTYLIDAKTFLLFGKDEQQESQTGPITLSTRYTDYRSVDGVMLPYVVTMESGNFNMKLSVKSYAQNTNVSDDTFEKK